MQPKAGPSPRDISMDADTLKFLEADTFSPTDVHAHAWGTHHDTSESDEDQETLERFVRDQEEDLEEEDFKSGLKPCSSHGCANTARSRGLCPSHGGGTRCRSRGCTKHVVSGGLCVGHGGGRRCRAESGCTSSAVSRGLCVQHGGGRKCNQLGCTKHVASGGLCRTHGGGRRCQVTDCMSSAQSRGLCYVHGGGGRCQREGCGSSAKKGGLCIAHGGGHRCQVAGCTSSAVSGARCRAHGGGRRCAVEGCTSSAKTGGRCIAHGGGKRCTVSGCTSSAQRLGLCKAHGGGRRCVVKDCANSAVSRGRCIAHGGGKRCVYEGCTTTARKGGYCFAHGGRSTATSKSKMVSPASSVPSTPSTIHSNPSPWSTAEVKSPIPPLALPPRALLPPISAMLMAHQPGIIRRTAQIPPIRNSGTSSWGLVDFTRHETPTHNVIDGEIFVPDSAWPRRVATRSRSARNNRSLTASKTTPPANRAGYSWQRLQETIRRESLAQGLGIDDESEYGSSNEAIKLEGDDELYDDEVSSVSSGTLYWTRSRGPVST